MDIQAFVNAISESGNRERSNYHLTLGGLISKLKDFEQSKDVEFDVGGHPDYLNSYRGYYSDLAFSTTEKVVSVSDVLKEANKALNTTFQGYKGGDYIMTESTPLWKSEYGTSGDNEAVMGIVETENKVIFITKKIEYRTRSTAAWAN